MSLNNALEYPSKSKSRTGTCKGLLGRYSGTGIIEERKPTIFKRSKNRDTSKGGMGIGLSLVKMIVKGYGGKVWVENRVHDDYKKGSNFIIALQV